MSRHSGRSRRPHEWNDHEIPLWRYFLFAGGALLTLLFVADWVMPRPANDSINSEPKLPIIRIYSELKGPEAVVIDTSRPIIAATLTAQPDVAAAPQASTTAVSHVGETLALLARLSPEQTGTREPKKAERKQQRSRQAARARARHPTISVAQRPDFGFFDTHPAMFVQQDPHIRESFAQLLPRPPKHAGATRKVLSARIEYPRRPSVCCLR